MFKFGIVRKGWWHRGVPYTHKHTCIQTHTHTGSLSLNLTCRHPTSLSVYINEGLGTRDSKIHQRRLVDLTDFIFRGHTVPETNWKEFWIHSRGYVRPGDTAVDLVLPLLSHSLLKTPSSLLRRSKKDGSTRRHQEKEGGEERKKGAKKRKRRYSNASSRDLRMTSRNSLSYLPGLVMNKGLPYTRTPRPPLHLAKPPETTEKGTT